MIRVASTSIYNTPLLVTQTTLDDISEYVEQRHSEPSIKVDTPTSTQKSDPEIQYDAASKIGVISIEGPLTYAPQPFAAVCGLSDTNYQSIIKQFNSLVHVGAKTIVLDVDSPGGQAYGCFETGRYLRKEADKHNIKLISYVDGLAASAGYALASATHEVIMNPASEVGSIGVIIKLRNTNQALRKAGIEDTYIYRGDAKIPFMQDGSFKKEFLEDIQIKIDSLYKDFVGYVAAMRGISGEAVKSTKARIFVAGDAIKHGLVDRQMTRQEFSDYLESPASTAVSRKPMPQNLAQPKKAASSYPSTVRITAQDGVTKYLLSAHKKNNGK